MKRITIDGYTRISKVEARRRFNDGEDIIFTPCLCRPNDKLFGLSIRANIAGWEFSNTYEPYRFDEMVELFTIYNCRPDTGRYPAYYREV